MGLDRSRLRVPSYLPTAGAAPASTGVSSAGGAIPGRIIGLVPSAEFSSEAGNALSGRMSLLMLDTIIVGMILFYIWTRNVQGGG